MSEFLNFSDLQSDASIVLFNLNYSGNEVFSFCGVEDVVYKGVPYTAIPCEITGMETNLTNMSEPQLTLFDNGLLGLLVDTYDNLLGRSIKVRTVRKSLVNSENLFYDVAPSEYIIAQKTSDIPYKSISFKLKHLGSLSGKTPARNIYSTCSWKRYRGAGCEYSGTAMFDLENKPTDNPSEDLCALTLEACQIRNNTDNFSGIPTLDTFG